MSLPIVSKETVCSVAGSIKDEGDNYLEKILWFMCNENVELANSVKMFAEKYDEEYQPYITTSAALCYAHLRSQVQAEEMEGPNQTLPVVSKETLDKYVERYPNSKESEYKLAQDFTHNRVLATNLLLAVQDSFPDTKTQNNVLYLLMSIYQLLKIEIEEGGMATTID